MTALTHARTDDTSTPASPVDNHPHARWFPVVPEWFRNHRSVVRSPVVPVVPYPVGMGTTTGEPLTPWELPRNRPHSGTTDGTTHRPTQETAP